MDGVLKSRVPIATDDVIVSSGEANPGLPLMEAMERMAKRRFQDPKPFREGRWWWLKVRVDEYVNGKIARRQKRMKIAEATMSAAEARKVAAEMLRPINRGIGAIGSATPFRVYVGTYRDSVLPEMASTTRINYNYTIDKYLLPVFGEKPLRDLTPATLRTYFIRLQANLPTKRKVRDALGSILSSAVTDELLDKNPLASVELKNPEPERPTITPEDFHLLVSQMAEPYATMVYVCLFAGLRVSELIGLKWEDVRTESIIIDERYCRGDWNTTKTKASRAPVYVHASVVQRIQHLRDAEVTVNWGANGAKKTFKLVRSSGPKDLVFQSLRKGVPMNDQNILRRHIKPAAEQLGIGWVNWRVLRRSYATWLMDAGVEVKAAQGQMRHARFETTANIYAQIVPESQRRAVEKMTAMVAERLERAWQTGSTLPN